MKLRTWLTVSYFVVMMLPLLCAYLFYLWLDAVNDKQLFHDFLSANTAIAKLEKELQNPSLYLNNDQNTDRLDRLKSEYESFTLYNSEGTPLYSSHPEVFHSPKLTKEELYLDLYKLRSGLRTHAIKKPVFYNNSIIGFYNIEITRVENIAKMNAKRNMIIILFIVSMICIYAFTLFLVKRKLTNPFKRLMQQMSDFAAGQKVEEVQGGRDEIGALIRHFAKMRTLLQETQGKIKQQQKEKELMIASISHDLKTPLTSLRTYSESLKQADLASKERNEYIEVILDKADYMKQMLDDLTTYALLQSDEKEMERVEVDSVEFIEMLFSGYEKICYEKQIQLTQMINVSGTLFVNSKEMVRVVDNLVANAIRYTRADAHIWLGAYLGNTLLPTWLFPVVKQGMEKDQRQGIFIVVQNEGEAIPEKEQQKVFEPLYQVEQARTKTKTGTGLGLSIAKRIIEKHEGTIQLFSESGYGTTIVCWLPLYKDDRGDEVSPR